MEIRSARPGDIEALVDLLRQLFALEEDFTSDERRQSSGLQMLIEAPSAAVFVAVQDTEVIGMVSGQLTVSTAEGGYALLVEDLIVADERRGRGIGKSLLRAVADWGAMNGADRMQLLADSTNHTALSFYKHNGWRITQLICLRSHTPSTTR